jgi:hypothetical protein
MKHRLFLLMLFFCVRIYSQYDFRSGYIIKKNVSLKKTRKQIAWFICQVKYQLIDLQIVNIL